MPNRSFHHRRLTGVVAVLWVITLLTGWLVQPPMSLAVAALPDPVAAGPSSFAHYNGTVAPGETVAPAYQLRGAQPRQANAKMVVAASPADAALELSITDAAAQPVFSQSAGPGQTLWTTATLLPGVTTFTIANSSASATLAYDLWLYDVGQVPAAFDGTSRGISSTWGSQVSIQFPADGLYTFISDKIAGRYQLALDENYLQKTIEDRESLVHFVSAGVHTLTVNADGQQAETTWAVSVSGPGAPADSLPLTKSGGHLGGPGNAFTEEWLPLRLGGPTAVNLALALTGSSSDRLQAYLFTPGSATPFTHTQVFGNETVWWTVDLLAGVSRLQLEADAANTAALAYTLKIGEPASLSTGVSGAARGPSHTHSHLRFQVPDAGLYDFSYGLAGGRYQFLVDGNNYLQKTVEAPGTVRYYLQSGSHELTIDPDSAQESTAWSMSLAPSGQPADSLPFTRDGGSLGGAGNVFASEWLPVYVPGVEGTNFRVQVSGSATDALRVAIWQPGAATASYLSAPIHGGETFWWTSDFAPGLNRMQVLADAGNTGALRYALSGQSVGQPPQTWQGTSLATGAQASVQVAVSVGGTYHVNLHTPQGFALVRLDGNTLMAQQRAEASAATGHTTEFDVPLAPGTHRLTIQHVAEYPLTAWELGITPSATPGPLAHFTGSLAAGERVAPELPLPGAGVRNLNFRLAVQGESGSLDLAITSGKGTTAFSGRALAGEVAWAPIVLDSGPSVFDLQNSGAAPLTYDLTVMDPGSTPADWSGVSQAGSTWPSAINVNFPADGLYKFDFGIANGRYQLTLGNNQIARVIESNSSALFYLAAGQQTLTLLADPAAKTVTQWSLHLSQAGSAADSLPYNKSGGHLWGDNGTFHEEWLPIRLDTAAAANFEFKLVGASSDAVDIFFVKDGTATITESGPRVFGGETVWTNVQIPAGTTRMHLVAVAGNSGPLAYFIQAEAPAAAPAGWSGTSTAGGNSSHLVFTAPEAGLYRFKYGLGAGRYQLVVAGDPTAGVIKTVETAGEATYYLAAGAHDLTIVQDSRPAVTAWSLEIAPTGEREDSLPYARAGGRLGGQANDFRVEWLPLFAPSAGKANFRLAATGDRGDLLHLALLRPPETSPAGQFGARGGEIVWWTAELAQGLNWIILAAEGTNGAPLVYDLTITPVPGVRHAAPFSWSGVAAGDGDNSRMQFQAVVGGTYHVLAQMPSGFANVFIDGPEAQPLRAQGTMLEFDVPLSAGIQQLEVRQGKQAITTTWTVTITLQDALAPKVTSRLPLTAMNDAASTITVEGENFQPGAVVQAGTLPVGTTRWLDANHLAVPIPARQPVGSYDLTITNPDGKSISAPGGLQILQGKPLYLYFPAVAQRRR